MRISDRSSDVCSANLIRLAIPQPAIGRNGPDASYGQWQWRAPSATLEIQPRDLRRYRLETHGPQDVAVTIGGTQRRYRLASEAAVAVARFHGDGRDRKSTRLNSSH